MTLLKGRIVAFEPNLSPISKEEFLSTTGATFGVENL